MRRRTLQRIVGIAVIAPLALSFLFGLHYYLARRLVFDPGLAAPWHGLVLALIVLGGLSLVAQPIGERTLGPPASRWISWPASLWMGLMFYLTVSLLFSDALLWLAGAPAQAAVSDAGGASPVVGPRAALVVGVALAFVAVGVRTARRGPDVKSVEIAIDRWPRALDGFRIAQISDIHIGPILDRRFSAEVTSRVNALDADVVAITGDLVDGSAKHLAEEVAPFGSLRAKQGVFFVTGNHDHYSGARDWTELVEKLGIRVLRNERVTLERDGACFDLAGVEDHHARLMGETEEDLEAALADRDVERPVVLLAHDPNTFRRARHAGVDLQLSGHTHGGQIWPFRYLVRLATPWVAGLYREGPAQIYVSRGTGFWGPPMRFLAPAEITEITLRAPPA